MILEPGPGTNWDETIETYEELHLKEQLEQALQERSSTNPREIQRRALKPILDGHDVLVQAPGFADQMDTMIIGTLQRIDTSIQEVQALLLTSTREVADRIQLCANSLGKLMGLKLHACIASHCSPKFAEDLETLRAGVHIVTGTPGRVHDMIRRRVLKPDKITMVVLHRSNDIFSYGLGDQLFNLLKDLPQPTQLVALCEGDMDEESLHELLAMMHSPIRIVLNAKRLPKESKHYFVCVDHPDDRFDMLKDVLDNMPPNDSSIFCSTREQADFLTEKIRGATPFRATIYNDADEYTTKVEGESSKSDSLEETLEDNPVTPRQQLVDIGHLTQLPLLINYELPTENIKYAARLKRDSRFGKGGVVINVILQSDLFSLRAIRYNFGFDMDMLPEDISNLLVRCKDREAPP